MNKFVFILFFVTRCAFVLPTYEIHEAAALPQDKSQLAELVKRLFAKYKKKSNRRLIISPQAPSEAVPFKGFGEFFFPNFVLLCNGCVLHFDSGSQSVCHQLLPAGVGPR